jgi:hypothetical protein
MEGQKKRKDNVRYDSVPSVPGSVQVIHRCVTLSTSPIEGRSLPSPTDPAVADVLYFAAVAHLTLVTSKSAADAASMGLAFFGAATTLARALRAPVTLRDWGARVALLAAAARAARVDAAAPQELLSEGMLAAVELCLHVRSNL